MDTDAKIEPILFPSGSIASGKLSLDVHGALKRIDDAGELDERPVAHQLHDAPRIASHGGIDDA
jgi:hypothetical protein